MKKAMMMVGTGVLMMVLTMSSGFAQQPPPKAAAPESAVSLPKPGGPADLVKDKAPVPAVAAPGAGELGKSTTPAGVNPVKKEAATKAMEPAKTGTPATEPKAGDKPAADKQETPISTDKASTSTPAAGQDAGQDKQENKIPGQPEAGPAAGKQIMEKASGVKETVKPPATK